jgi:hypothetical protein
VDCLTRNGKPCGMNLFGDLLALACGSTCQMTSVLRITLVAEAAMEPAKRKSVAWISSRQSQRRHPPSLSTGATWSSQFHCQEPSAPALPRNTGWWVHQPNDGATPMLAPRWQT